MRTESPRNVVLCTPPWSYASLAGREPDKPWSPRRDISGQGFLPSLGLHHLATTLESHGHTARVFEGYHRTKEDLVHNIRAQAPDVVGVTVATALWPAARLLISDLRAALGPGLRIAVGGPHADLQGSLLRTDCPDIDRVFTSPAEDAFATWVADGDETGHAEPPGGHRAFAAHPPGWSRRLVERIPWQHYTPNVMFLGPKRFATSVTTTGCEGSCAFCATGSTSGGRRVRAPGELLEELSFLSRALGISWVNFMDDQTLFADADARAERLLSGLIDRRLPLGWTAYLDRYDLDESWFRLMRRAGCRRLLLTVETGSPRIAAYVKHPPVPLSEVAKTAERAHRAGIQTCARFQFGFPGETWSDGLDSIRFACSLPLVLVSFMRAMVYPGSRMACDLARKHLLADDDARWSFYGRPATPDAMTCDEQDRLVKLGLLRFYGRHRVLGARIRDSLSDPFLWRPWSIARRVFLDGVD